jgi:hypothetical protein
MCGGLQGDSQTSNIADSKIIIIIVLYLKVIVGDGEFMLFKRLLRTFSITISKNKVLVELPSCSVVSSRAVFCVLCPFV